MKKWFLGFAVALAASSASAETLKNNLPVCASRELLNQFTTAVLTKDERGIDYLLDHGCVPGKPGAEVSILEEGTVLRVRIYMGSQTTEGWTFVSAIYPDGKRPN